MILPYLIPLEHLTKSYHEMVIHNLFANTVDALRNQPYL